MGQTMRAKVYGITTALILVLGGVLLAQPEQHTGKLLRNIRSFNMEKIKQEKIKTATAYFCGEFGDKKILQCSYNDQGQLIDSIGYPDARTLELFRQQLSREIPVDPAFYVDNEIAAYKYHFEYNSKGLRNKTQEYVARPSPKFDLLNYSIMNSVYSYDSADRLIRVDFTSPTGVKVQEDTYTYDKGGNVIEWKQFKSGSPRNFTARYTYDDRNNLIEYYRTNANGEFAIKERSTFDVNGNLKRWEDISKSGLTLYRKDFTYDTYGNMVECLGFIESEDFDSKLQKTYDTYGNLIQSIASRGRITGAGDFQFRDVFTETFSYNENNMLIRVVRAHKRMGELKIEEYQYDDNGNIMSRSDSEGGCVSWGYTFFE